MHRRLVLILSGGIAAYKSLDLIRRLRERGHSVRAVMTANAQHFVTPLSVGALTNERVFTDLFSLDDEREIGHIRLARDCDAVVVAPATANLIARMAHGIADDLATAVLLATDKPVLIAPAMNPFMWQNPATERNVAQLKRDGVHFIGPTRGEMAERGEAGVGRLADVPDIIAAIEALPRDVTRALGAPAARERDSAITTEVSNSGRQEGALTGCHVLVTAGPTHEPIDPVRYLANRSSGKQGYAIAAAAAAAGARVTLVSGPVSLSAPDGVDVVKVVTANEMLEATRAALPADIAIFAAAVADWRIANPKAGKIKKSASAKTPTLKLTENPDILATVARLSRKRPGLVIGFAAETDDVLAYARRKLKTKKADWIVANDVSPETGIMGGDMTTVHVISHDAVETWPDLHKSDVARRLIEKAAVAFTNKRRAAE